MASDSHASYTKIGFTVFIGLAALVGTLIHFGGIGSSRNEILIETYYDKPVNGLAVGSDVNFRGVKIGSVREINFIGNKYDAELKDFYRIYILMALNVKFLGADRSELENYRQGVRDLTLKHGLRATVSASGITGMSRMELDFYPDEGNVKPELPKWTTRYPYVPPKISLLDSFGDAAVKVMNQINQMDIKAAWSNMNSTVESLAAMSESTRNMVESRRADVDRILGNIDSATMALRELAERVRDNPSLLLRENSPDRLPETSR